MHSGSSISPKHPAIPVSIGIASLVLEGRSSALDDSSIHASSHGSGGGGEGETGAGGTGGSSNGGATDEDGGFCGKKRPSSSTNSSSSAGGPSGGGSASSSGASTLQECSLLAITEAHKLANATTTNYHMTDASQRINLKLQQIRSSCPGTSKDEVHHLVTVSGEPGSGRGRSTIDGDMMYGVETFVNIASSGRFGGGGSSSAASSWSHEAGPSAASSAVIYSGFEKMNVLGTVSPIKNHPIGNSFINFSSSSPNSSMAAAAAAAAAVASSASHSRKSTGSSSSIKQQQQQQQRPREGPHCEQFLKKIGLNKPDSSEGPEHCCSYRNKYCLRWQVYFKQLSTILTNGEAVCIEVYLGPENHTILLEQWILKLVMTKSPTTMTLQSLCAAIRSQLYFSQISAWTDLIKNSLEPEIFNHPRIKNVSPMMKGPSSAANATTTGGKASFISQQAKLDILFRIRTYDSTACFNEKPLVHNFPDASVADGFVIQVCLKSLPRLDRIPGIHAALDATKMIGATGTAGILSGDRLDRLPCHEKGKHRCAFREFELEDDEEGECDDPRMGEGDEGMPGMLVTTAAAISHREKQLLKYKKRMQKREKKKKSSGSSSSVAECIARFAVASNGGGGGGACSSSSNSSGSGGSLSTSSRSNTNGARHGSSADSSSYASPMSYSSCSNGSGSGTGSSISKSPSTGPYGSGGVAGNGATTTVVYPNVTTNGNCTNGNCHNALTSSINSIQPPLYSSNQQQNGGTTMMVCFDDRYQSIAANSKSTQTSAAFPVATDGAVSFVSSVATQTDGGGATTSANNYCADCCRSRGEEEKSVSSYSTGSVNGTVKVVLGTGPVGSSISSTNSDRHMQYFNDYYRSYDIINDNCDKRHPRPQTASAHHLRVVDAPMETSITTTGKGEGVAFPEKMVAENGTRPRPCFIVGGDGYEGDEDEGEGAGGASGVIMPNSGGDERPLQKGDLLLQAIQRTATLNSGSGRNQNVGSFATEVNHSQVMNDGGVLSEHKKSGDHALNNNNYVTANNNNIGEGSRNICAKVDREVGIPFDEGGQQKGPNGGNATEHWQHHQHRHEAGDGNGGSAAKCERSECDTFSKEKLDLGDCRLCKRQKTKHNFKLNLTNLLSSAVMKVTSGRDRGLVSVAPPKKPIITTVVDCGSTPPGCRRTLSESLVGHLTIPVGCSKGGAGAHGTMAGEEGACCDDKGREEANNGLYPIGGADISPGDSPMLSSSTGAVGNGGVFTFDQMKSYRRAFSEDVIDTITTSTCNGRSHFVQASEDSTEDDDDTSGDNENEHELDLCERVPKRCGCNGRLSNGSSPLAMEPSAHTMAHHRAHTSTPAPSSGAGKCKEPLYISCLETDCSVSTASSVSPHKKQILSCAAIGGAGSGSRPLEANRTGGGGSTPNVQQLMQYKSSPKINLNYVFCLSPLARDDSGFTSGSSPATSTSYPATSPIAIDGSGAALGVTPVGNSGAAGCFGSSGSKGPRSQNGGSSSLFRYDFEESPISPIAGTIKSKSAPAFPFSPPTTGALSPRFLRNAQQQRVHRTRYPSERSSVSERSSIGSDEQLSDDDLSYLLDSSNGYSPLSSHQLALMSGGSPLKLGQAAITRPSQMLSKVLNRNLFKFGRAPMLGTLEESLLQRRLSPKFQVADFKVLLGASGSFCPTQLTIPVASYFYELPGQHLTTPYVCELRLPRKGYSIPRTGTVQATLLNPLGTVVRMFVVPYDFRDMPAMSTTFIRQRILACDESSLKLLGKNIEQLSNAEQMKLLRYAIHLRFQTSRSGKLSLHTDIRLLISRRTDCDTAAAHAKNLLESPNELKVVTIVPENPKFSLRIDKQ